MRKYTLSKNLIKIIVALIVIVATSFTAFFTLKGSPLDVLAAVVSESSCPNGVCSAQSGECIAIHYCDQLTAEGHCINEVPELVLGPATVDSNQKANQVCKFVQVDVLDGRNNSCINGHINGDPTTLKAFSIASADPGCGAPPPTEPPQQSTPPEDNFSASCTDIRAFDTNWNRLTASDLSLLSAGDVVRFTVRGNATSGSFDKARFALNNTSLGETSTERPGNPQEFYIEFTIPEGITSFRLEAEIHHNERNSWH